MIGRRCDLGCETWPDSTAYARCPVCDEPTKRYRDVTPLDRAEAYSRRMRLDFEAFYARWDAERSPERLLPGAAEDALVRPPAGLLAPGGAA